MSGAARPSTGLAAAVADYNRAAAELENARRLLHREMDAEAATRAARRLQPPCGTPEAYRAHRRAGQVIDPACVEANSRGDRQRRSRRQAVG